MRGHSVGCSGYFFSTGASLDLLTVVLLPIPKNPDGGVLSPTVLLDGIGRGVSSFSRAPSLVDLVDSFVYDFVSFFSVMCLFYNGNACFLYGVLSRLGCFSNIRWFFPFSSCLYIVSMGWWRVVRRSFVSAAGISLMRRALNEDRRRLLLVVRTCRSRSVN